MNKTKIKISNSKNKEQETILEFLFKENESNPQELENYIGKYLESREKWRLVFDCIQKIDISSSIRQYLYELIDNIKQVLPNLKISVVIYEKTSGKNKVYTRDKNDETDYINDSVFSSLNLFNAHLELTKYFASKKSPLPNYKLLPLEKDNMELGYIFFEIQDVYEDSDIDYLENLCRYIISAMETIGLYESIKKENEEKVKFTASFSHEIKTPLNGILAYSDLLKKNSCELSAELKNYVENIYISSKQLKCLILDIIESAKFEYGKASVRKQIFETKKTIENILKIFTPSIKEKNIELNPILMQVNIVSDYTKFNQILYNLISNAVKFSNQNSSISITSWAQDEYFYFEIKNQGEPIDKKTAEKIFSFLHTSNDNARKNPEGSGIGLCVCKQLIELLKGQIAFESTNNETVFKFCVPV